jgi:hypothetical protein
MVGRGQDELGGRAMHAVFTQVSISDYEAAQKMLQSDLIPMVKQAPGFVAGWWLAPVDGKSGSGVSVEVFESEDAARSFVKQFEAQGPPDTSLVTIESLEVREVAGNA